MQNSTNNKLAASAVLKTATITLMKLEADYENASNAIILTDADYAGLKNAEMRKAYVTQKLGVLGAEVLKASIAKKEAEFTHSDADDVVRCAKYLIIQAAGKLVA